MAVVGEGKYSAAGIVTLAITLLAIVIAVVMIGVTKLMYVPRGFTEVYFIHPEKLPIALVPNETFAVEFVIANREGKSLFYTITIVACYYNNTTGQLVAQEVLLVKSVWVGDGQDCRVSEPVALHLPQGDGYVKIITSVLPRDGGGGVGGKVHELHFWARLMVEGG